jgi:NADH:ubiquinone oxidoreductase subunit F (NADH-binding)
MPITDAPRIVTRRLQTPRSWTLESYLDDGGYDGLRKALSMTPQEITAYVNAANILGRGGAGFEAGRKWGMLAKSQPVYLTINGDESEPATFKDHMLIEGDPHLLIEGALICAYAIGADQIFLFVRGEFPLGLERLQAALNEAYEYGAVGRRRRAPWRRGVHLRGGDGAAREPRGQAGLSPDKAALLPCRHRPLRRPHDRQQRRDRDEPALGHAQRW